MRIRLSNCLQMVLAAVVLLTATACEIDPNNGDNNGNNNDTDKQLSSSKEFKIENVRIEHTSIKADILPNDKDSEYIVFIAELKHFKANRIDTADKLLEDDYLYFREYATEFKLDMHDFLSQVGWLVKGDKRDYGAVNLYPDTDYVIYCYGVEFEGNDNYTATTDVDFKVVRTTAPEMLDVTFDITANVEGNYVKLDIEPNNYEGLYYHYVVDDTDLFYIHPEMEINDEYIAHYRNTAFKEFNKKINDEGYAPSSFCHKGKATITKRYTANTNYMVISFAVSQEQTPLLCSIPSVAYFTTGNQLLSDMSFNIEVTNITPYYAYLDITPSTDDPYACVFLSTDQMPNSGDELTDMEIIMEYYQPAILHGKHSETLTPLMPSTEYVVVAFGCEDDTPTSEMFTFTFTSGEATEGDVAIEAIELIKLYDAKAILALDESYAKVIGEAECIGIVEAKTSAPANALYFWWFEEWQRIEYTDEAFLEDLLMYDPANNPEPMQMFYSIDENDKFLFAGIAEDENGNFSKIYYSDSFLITEDMVSPAEEFITWMESRK